MRFSLHLTLLAIIFYEAASSPCNKICNLTTYLPRSNTIHVEQKDKILRPRLHNETQM